MKHSVTPEQVYAISLECAKESASTTEQITAVIRKYQNPTMAAKIRGFGFLLSDDSFPPNLDEMIRADIDDYLANRPYQ